MIVRELITKLGFNVDEQKLRKFNNDIKGIKTLTNELVGDLRGVANGVRNIGIGLTAFVTAPIIGLGIASVRTTANLEKARIALEVFLGSEEKALAVQKELIEFAKETPFQILGIQETAGQLLAAGIEVDSLIETMNALGNAAKGDEEVFQRLVLNFAQVKTQGKLTGRELRDFLVNQVPLIKLLAAEMGVAESSIQDMVSRGEISFKDMEGAFFNASKEGGFFFDLMKKQSKTLTGIWSNLQDTVTKLFNEFGKAIDDTLHLKEVLKALIAVVDRWTESFRKLSPWFKGLLVITALLLAALGPLLILIGLIASAVLGLAAAALVLDVAILPIIGIVLAIIAILSLLGVAIFLVIDDFITWKKKGDSVIGSMLAKFKEFKDGIKIMLDSVGQVFSLFWESLKMGFTELWADIMSNIPEPIKKIGRFLFPGGGSGENFSGNQGPVPAFFSGGPSLALPGVNGGNTMETNVSIEVPPGTTEQQKTFLEDSAKKVYTEFTHMMLADALNSNPRNEN